MAQRRQFFLCIGVHWNWRVRRFDKSNRMAYNYKLIWIYECWHPYGNKAITIILMYFFLKDKQKMGWWHWAGGAIGKRIVIRYICITVNVALYD
jgi:hypothetical protein